MSFTYKEIKRAIRWKEKDNDEARFSDYDIRDAVNEVIRYISNSSALTNADFNEKSIHFDEREVNEEIEDIEEHISFKFDGIDLPEDFVALVSVKGRKHDPQPLEPCLSMNVPAPWEYKIVGNKIYCGLHHFVLNYKAALPEVKEDEDVIELPYMFKDHFVQLARMVLNQAENDIMRGAVDTAVQELIPKRRYRNPKIAMPFKIGR